MGEKSGPYQAGTTPMGRECLKEPGFVRKEKCPQSLLSEKNSATHSSFSLQMEKYSMLVYAEEGITQNFCPKKLCRSS